MSEEAQTKTPTEVAIPTVDFSGLRALLQPFLSGLPTTMLAVKQLVVVDDETLQSCVDLRNRAAERVAQITERLEPYTSTLWALHRQSTGVRGEFTKPWEDIIKIADSKAKPYALAERKAKEEAEKRLAVESLKLQRQLQDQAEDLMAAGDVREAKQVMAQAEMAAETPVLPDALPKLENARTTDKWIGSVHDLTAIIKGVAEGRVQLMQVVKGGEEEPFLLVNPKVLKALTDRYGRRLEQMVPGIKVKPDIAFGRKGKR